MARFGFFKTGFRRELLRDSSGVMESYTNLPFTLEEFTQVYNNPLVQDILFRISSYRKFLDTGLTFASPIEEIAKLVATHIQKAALSWELMQYQQRRKHADTAAGDAGPGTVAHTVSDRKLNRFLSAILSKPEIKHEDLLFGHSPYLSACMTGSELTYFRVNPSTLQAKLILEFDPHQIIFTAPRDIWSATIKHNSTAILDTFYNGLSRNDVSAKILTALIYLVSEERNPIEIHRQIDKALKAYLAGSEVYSLDPAKSKYPLEHHHGYTPQSLMARTPHTTKTHGQKRPYNEMLIGRHESIRVIKIIVEESDWQAAKNAALMGNIDAQNGIEKLQEVQRNHGVNVERVPDTEPRFKIPTDANPLVRLNYAVFTHNKNMIEELLGPLDNPTEKCALSAELGKLGQSLQTACYVGDIAVINKLLDISPGLIHHAQGMPLLTAVYRRNGGLVQLLMARGADPGKCRRELQIILQTNMTDSEREQYEHLLSFESIDITHSSPPNDCIEYLPKTMCNRTVYRLAPEHLPDWDNITELPPTEVWQSLADNYINLPYEDEWEKRFAVEDKIVYRPNHDVTHAIRQQGYIDYLIYRIETEGKAEYKHLITKEVHSLLSLTTFIGRAGRTNEYRAFADPRNTERSANIVTAIARRYKFNPDLIEVVVHCIRNDKTIIEADAEMGTRVPEKLVQLMRTLLHESHAIDMVRMLTKDDFEKKLKPLMERAFRYFFDDNLEKDLIEDVLLVAQTACKLTGNMCIYAGEYEDNLELKAHCVQDVSYGTAQMMGVLSPYLESPAAPSTPM